MKKLKIEIRMKEEVLRYLLFGLIEKAQIVNSIDDKGKVELTKEQVNILLKKILKIKPSAKIFVDGN